MKTLMLIAAVAALSVVANAKSHRDCTKTPNSKACKAEAAKKAAATPATATAAPTAPAATTTKKQ